MTERKAGLSFPIGIILLVNNLEMFLFYVSLFADYVRLSVKLLIQLLRLILYNELTGRFLCRSRLLKYRVSYSQVPISRNYKSEINRAADMIRSISYWNKLRV
jgi:hypothetical protein